MAVLFYGPEARDKAIHRADEIGRVLSDPIGDKGLKVADSRRIVELSTQSGVGDRAPSIVVGPLDRATPEAADALLKTLEDLSEAPLRLVLWADDLSEVAPTIRSRTHQVWCPPGPTYLDPLYVYDDQAKELCQAVLAEDPVKILGVLEDVGKDWPDLLRALCVPLSQEVTGDQHEAALNAWLKMKPSLDGKGGLLAAADALLPEM